MNPCIECGHNFCGALLEGKECKAMYYEERPHGECNDTERANLLARLYSWKKKAPMCHECHEARKLLDECIAQLSFEPKRSHGEWIYKGGKYWCSSCGEKAIYHSHFKEPLPHLTNFCPNCGADMRKEGEEE